MTDANKKLETEEIIPCSYAGDPDDEYCSTCNGKTMEIDGKTFSCKECQSYTPREEVPETPVNVDETPREDKVPTSAPSYIPQGVATCIKAESGLSIETKKGWFRFTYTEERIIPESADIDKEREALWNDVHHEVDKQASAVKDVL